MVDQKLLNWIKDQKSKGYTFEQLRPLLIQQGYNSADIKQARSFFMGNYRPPRQPKPVQKVEPPTKPKPVQKVEPPTKPKPVQKVEPPTKPKKPKKYWLIILIIVVSLGVVGTVGYLLVYKNIFEFNNLPFNIGSSKNNIGVTEPLNPNAVNCEKDIDCFIEESKSCSPATWINKYGLGYEITGLVEEKCNVYVGFVDGNCPYEQEELVSMLERWKEEEWLDSDLDVCDQTAKVEIIE
jgi:hypothetical protein